MPQSPKVGIVTSVLVDGQDLALFLRNRDEPIGFGAGNGEGLFDDDCGWDQLTNGQEIS